MPIKVDESEHDARSKKPEKHEARFEKGHTGQGITAGAIYPQLSH